MQSVFNFFFNSFTYLITVELIRYVGVASCLYCLVLIIMYILMGRN